MENPVENTKSPSLGRPRKGTRSKRGFLIHDYWHRKAVWRVSSGMAKEDSASMVV